MKTNSISSELKSRSEQLSTRQTGLARINFARRRVNRSLDTFPWLNLHRSRTPELFGMAEVVGKWVWIQFADKQPRTVTSQLSELGFHWNNTRQVIPQSGRLLVTGELRKDPDQSAAGTLVARFATGSIRPGVSARPQDRCIWSLAMKKGNRIA